MQARRPARNRELKEARQAIELVRLLRVSLLELADIAVQQNRSPQHQHRHLVAVVPGESETFLREASLEAEPSWVSLPLALSRIGPSALHAMPRASGREGPASR